MQASVFFKSVMAVDDAVIVCARSILFKSRIHIIREGVQMNDGISDLVRIMMQYSPSEKKKEKETAVIDMFVLCVCLYCNV